MHRLVTERERTRPTTDRGSVEAGDDEQRIRHGRERPQTGPSVGATSDEQAASFFDIGEAGGTGGEPAIGGGRAYARIVAVDIVSTDEVPSGYPLEIGTERALEFEVEFPDETQAVVYLEYRERGQDPRLARILENAGTPYGSYADLYGVRLLLEVVEGYWTLYVPRSSPRGSTRGVYGIWFGLVFNGFAVAGGLLSGGSLFTSLAFVLAFLCINLVVIPVTTLVDAWFLESHTDWEHGPLFWASCNAFPLLNVLVSALYLSSRTGVRSITP